MPSPFSSFPRANRGSALVAVLILSAITLVLIGSILRWAINERRLTMRSALLLESRNAAEALAEYGFSQIREKYETRGFANLDPDGSDALITPPASFWANSNVSTQSGDFELVGGTVQSKSTGSASYYYVDPANPNNANDPLKGKWVWRRDVAVIAKATVKHPSGAPITSYATQSISVRGAPLFAHAIFYNMDMEIAPGPNMEIHGPVHANGDLYLAHQSNPSENKSLAFKGQVTASGHLYHAWKYGVGGSNNSESLQNGNVTFINRSGDDISMRGSATGSGYNWYDSRLGGTSVSSDFRSLASQRWNGNLLTASHGVSEYKPVAIGEYREADPYNPSQSVKDPNKAPSNAARLIIEPSDYPTDPTSSNYVSRMEIEAQKYANDAGIYIKVTPPTSASGSATITASSRSKLNPSKNTTLSLPSNLVKFEKYTKNSSNSVTSGLYDKRRQLGVNLVTLDIDQLRKAVSHLDSSPTKLSSNNTYTPSSSNRNADAIGSLSASDWTGIVYVEVSGGPSTDPDSGATITSTGALASAANATAVRIINGKNKVPSYGSANEGLTIATNAPMYVQGDYNADGSVNNDSDSTSARFPETGEVPAALAADAITILSKNFDTTKSFTDTKPNATTTNIEVAAALLMGLTPTNPTSNRNGDRKLGDSSGGVHNFPRFLENWGGSRNVYIRGSLVALFESRVATEPWNTDFYGPPNRLWGFNELFLDGRYPPGTPRVMSYRRVDFTNLDAAGYSSTKQSFNW